MVSKQTLTVPDEREQSNLELFRIVLPLSGRYAPPLTPPSLPQNRRCVAQGGGFATIHCHRDLPPPQHQHQPGLNNCRALNLTGGELMWAPTLKSLRKMQSSSFSDSMHFSISVACCSILSSLSSRLKAPLIWIASLLFSISPLIFLPESSHHPSLTISPSSLQIFSCFLSELFRHTRHPSIPLSSHPVITLFLCLHPLYLFLHFCLYKIIYSSISPHSIQSLLSVFWMSLSLHIPLADREPHTMKWCWMCSL